MGRTRGLTILRDDTDDRLEELGLVSVVVPAFNEEAAIGGDLDTIIETMDAAGIDYEIIVVDDGSTDGTVDLVRQRPRVRLVRHPANLGVGAARTNGMRAARGNIIVTTDGDGTYPNREIPRLLRQMLDYDMVIGARRREAGGLPWLRTPAKTVIRWLASYVAGIRIPDLNSGLRCYRRDLAEGFVPLLPQGHSWESTMTLAFLTHGYTVKFVPVDYYRRRGGRSSFHPVRDTLRYLSLVLRVALYFRPLRLLGPLAALTFFVGAGILLREAAAGAPAMPGLAIGLLLTGVHMGMLALIADLIIKRSGRL